MIGAVGAAQPIYGPASIYPTTGVENLAIEAATFEPEIAEAASPPPPEPLNDPAADSIAASQMYPQLMVGSVYPGVGPDAVMALEEDAVGTADNDDRDDAMGQLLFGQSGGGQAPLDDEGAEVAESEVVEPEIMGDPAAAAEADAEDAEAADSAEQAGASGGSGNQGLSDEEMAQVRELADRDREVRSHEQAHKSVGGQYSGSMSFSYQQGPDGQRYATGGEVGIDVSPEQTPEATIAKMQQVRAAAMAPADPSPQDHAVASSAMATESQARAEAASENNQANAAGEGEGESGESSDAGEAEAAAAQSGAASSASSSGTSSTLSDNTSASSPAVTRSEPAATAGGSQTLSANRFVNAYAARSATDNDSSLNRFSNNVMSASYRPIDIVA
ncbi:MAG: hypothetical protein LIQ31_12320 [Planctomycetes bacterium]|nr:hypothetical protein [Planctomycetota bacterium]